MPNYSPLFLTRAQEVVSVGLPLPAVSMCRASGSAREGCSSPPPPSSTFSWGKPVLFLG